MLHHTHKMLSIFNLILYMQTHTVLRWTGTHWQLQSRTVPQTPESTKTSHQDGTLQRSAKQHHNILVTYSIQRQLTLHESKTNLCIQIEDGNIKYDTNHSNSLWIDHGLRGDGCEVGQVGQNIYHRHYRHGYNDGQGQIPTEGKGQRSSLTNIYSNNVRFVLLY